MCENCMHLEYDEASQQYVCSIDFMIDEDDLAKMNYHPSKQCPYYKVGDEYIWIRKQNM